MSIAWFTRLGHDRSDLMKITSTTKMLNSNAGIIRKKIGNTMYRVSVYHSTTGKENLSDKILRLAKNDLTRANVTSTIELPQTGRLLEGSS